MALAACASTTVAVTLPVPLRQGHALAVRRFDRGAVVEQAGGFVQRNGGDARVHGEIRVSLHSLRGHNRLTAVAPLPLAGLCMHTFF